MNNLEKKSKFVKEKEVKTDKIIIIATCPFFLHKIVNTDFTPKIKFLNYLNLIFAVISIVFKKKSGLNRYERKKTVVI